MRGVGSRFLVLEHGGRMGWPGPCEAEVKVVMLMGEVMVGLFDIVEAPGHDRANTIPTQPPSNNVQDIR